MRAEQRPDNNSQKKVTAIIDVGAETKEIKDQDFIFIAGGKRTEEDDGYNMSCGLCGNIGMNGAICIVKSMAESNAMLRTAMMMVASSEILGGYRINHEQHEEYASEDVREMELDELIKSILNPEPNNPNNKEQ